MTAAVTGALAASAVWLVALSLVWAQFKRTASLVRLRETQLELERSAVRQELEEKVAQRTAELAEANKGLESFSYSVSHDLRTPLRAISGFAQILSRRHKASLDEEGRHYMDNIVRASAQMGRLIEDLLAYSRLGRKAVRVETLSLADSLSEVVAHFKPRMAQLGAKVTLPAELPLIQGDASLVTQIFINLIDNALTYCRPAAAPVIEVTCSERGNEVVVAVKDQGIGIDPEHFEEIFGVFQRLHSEDEYPGTGIGLATVRQAAEMLGGKAWVESTLGAGSTFHVSFARAGAAPPVLR